MGSTLIVCVLLCEPLATAQAAKLIVVNGPAVIAFFPPVTEKDLSRDPDTSEAHLIFSSTRKVFEVSCTMLESISKKFTHRHFVLSADERQRLFIRRRYRSDTISLRRESHLALNME
jgi:hypothetical protein